MKKTIGVAAGIVLVMLVATTLWARQLTSGPVTGRIVSVDSLANTFTVETSSGSMTFKTSSSTTFKQKDMTVHMDDLKVGDQVRVTFSGDGSARTATSVETTSAAPAQTGTASNYDNSGNAAGNNSTANNNSTTRTYDSASSTGFVTGRVTAVNVNGHSITVSTPSGSQTFQVGNNVVFLTRDGSNDFAGIKVGDQVRIETASDGSKTASRVEFVNGEETPVRNARTRKLPSTGSFFPLVGVIGGLMLGAGFIVQAYRKSVI